MVQGCTKQFDRHTQSQENDSTMFSVIGTQKRMSAFFEDLKEISGCRVKELIFSVDATAWL